jgi:hypothetical protein
VQLLAAVVQGISLQMTKGPAKPGLSNAARLLLLRRLVLAGILLRILLARLLILLAGLLVLARLLVLLRIICSNRDIGHRIIFQISVRKYFQTMVELATISKNTIGASGDIY